MRILLFEPTKNKSIYYGLAKTFRFCGFETAMVTNKSIFEIVQEFKPDILFCEEAGRAKERYPHIMFIEELVEEAADIFSFPDIPLKPYHKSDVMYVGDYHPILNKLISSNTNFKVFSNNKFLSVNHIGPTENLKPYYLSTQVCIATEPKHVYNCVFNKTKCVTNIKLGNSIDKYTFFVNNEDELVDALKINPGDDVFIKQGYEDIISNHTYFHRSSSLFTKLGLIQESQLINTRLESLKC